MFRNKEKKERLSFKRSGSNIGFALKHILTSSPLFFFLYYFTTILGTPLDFLSDTYLLRLVLNGDSSFNEIVIYIIVIIGLVLIFNTFCNYVWNVTLAGARVKVTMKLRKMLFKKASEVELACYENPAFYDKYVKAMDEADGRYFKVLSTIDNLIYYIGSLSLNSLMLFSIDPFLIVFGLLPLLLGFTKRWWNKLDHDHAMARKPIERRVNYVRRTFYLNEYAKEMRVGGMKFRMLNELQATYCDFKKMITNYGIKKAICRFIQQVGLEVITILGAMLYAVWCAVGAGTMSVGDCIVVLNSIGVISHCLNNIVQTFAEFGEHSLYIEDVRYFLDYEPKIREDEAAPKAHGGDIELKNVSFSYEGSDKEVLHNISLKIKKGEHIALVGHNGSGKTTLVKLLLRLYDPTNGNILLNDMNIKDYRLSSYRDNFSCVFQDFKVFSLSVKENIVLRNPKERDNELVTYALKESGAYDKISTFEKGIETTLTREFDDEGANLSVGEQQKVSLARVFAENAPCIILDEPSSALDPIAEHKMFQNMMKGAEGRSVIFISHRLSSAVSADRIFLLENGTVIESGSHKELMEKNGKYAEMFTLQAENYVESEATANG